MNRIEKLEMEVEVLRNAVKNMAKKLGIDPEFAKTGYMVIIERFERLCDCNQEVGDEILRKTFDTIAEANDFIASYKHNIQNSADPEFSLIEDRGGYINIIEMSPDEDFEFETRFTIKEVKIA